MRVLMLSTDRDIFMSGSEVQKRMIEYGKTLDELHIVVYTEASIKYQVSSIRIVKNVFVYATNTWFKPLYFYDAYKIGKKILSQSPITNHQSLITSQNPFETGLVGYWLKNKFKTPLEIQIHTDFLSPYFWRESLKNKIRVLLAKRLINKADRIRVVSDRIKNSLISQFPNFPISKITVRPIFVDIEKIKNSPIKTDLHKKYPNYNFIILMASRLTREKNIELAINAIQKILIHSNNSNGHSDVSDRVLLLIVGDGPEYKNLKFKIENLKLQNNVIFESWTDDLVSYYKTADLFLLTSNYEGYGRTVAEAEAAGSPVVMTDVGVARGKVIEIGNKDQLIAALNDNINNKLTKTH